MARTKSDISNSAIRIFLQDVGQFYDQARGFEKFVPKVSQIDELLEFFNYKCCYCGTPLSRKTVSQDHLIPMNKKSLGLHAWGNVVPCCRDCNNEKQQQDWRQFLRQKGGQTDPSFERKIQEFVEIKKYDPTLNLHEYADNLYHDVGEVAMTLIRLRYKQAEDKIKSVLGEFT